MKSGKLLDVPEAIAGGGLTWQADVGELCQ